MSQGRSSPQRTAGLTRRVAMLGVAVLAVVAVTLVALLIALYRLDDASTTAREDERAIAAALRVEGSVLEMSSAARGFLLGGNEAFLSSSEEARGALDPAIAELRAAVEGTPQADEAEALAQRVLQFRDSNLALIERARVDVATERATVTESGGQGLRDVSAMVDTLSGQLEADAARSEDDRDEAAAIAIAVTIIGTLATAALVLWGVLALRSRVAQPLDSLANTAVQLGAGDLGARAETGGRDEIGLLQGAFNDMADQLEEREVALRTSQETVEREAALRTAILGSSPDGMVFSDPDGTLTYFNPAFQQVVDAIVGHPVGIGTDVTTAHGIREVIAEEIDDPEGYWEAVRESLESAGPCVHVFRVPRLDRWFARLATRVRGEDGEPLGLLVLLRDVTAERATQREASITRQVIEASPDGIMLLDAESHALMTNARMDELMSDILGSATSMGEFTTADDWSERVAARMEDPERFLREIRELRADPTSHPMVEFRVAATDATYQRFVRPIAGPDGDVIGTVRLLRDMTAERAAERAKDDLMAAVSHELRTPLASILGFAELLETRQLDDAVQRRYAGTIHQEARRLTALVDDLIDLRLVEEGRLALTTEPVDVGELVREQAALFARRADRHSIDVDVADGPLVARGDRLRLAQVFSNLLSNAIKYSPDGGAVRVGATADNGSVRVYVSDEGIGIPVALQSRLFERFFRADRPSIRHIGGSGIGLALTRELVHALGGEIGFESTEGAGSTFWVDLPLSGAGGDA